MRVIECNVCGETLSAASDDELAQRWRSHHEDQHPSVENDEQQSRETIEREAYEASDS